MSRIIDICIINASFKSKSQISSYKHDKDFEILCCGIKARFLLLFTYELYWYMFHLNGAFWLMIIFVNTLHHKFWSLLLGNPVKNKNKIKCRSQIVS